MLCALIMAGGKGTRFWPLSTEKKPKQFLNLIGNETMIQMTVSRILPIIPINRIFICTCEKYVELVKEQLLGIPKENIIIEPEGKNTAPCIALSALIIQRQYKDATMLVLPSDHMIKEESEFRDIVLLSESFIGDNPEAIITLGSTPNRAETEYGYIKKGSSGMVINNHSIVKVEAFVEKPNLETAKSYLESGHYLWNSGMFLWNIDNIIMKFKNYLPEIYELLHTISYVEASLLYDQIKRNYNKVTPISIDYGILEKSNDIYVVPSQFGWDDLGSWNAIDRYIEKDKNDNLIAGVCDVEESSNNIIFTKKKVILNNINDLFIVENEDAIFISTRKSI